jgi:hypothetical protein
LPPAAFSSTSPAIASGNTYTTFAASLLNNVPMLCYVTRLRANHVTCAV